MDLSRTFKFLQIHFKTILNKKKDRLRSQAINYTLPFNIENQENNQRQDKQWQELLSTVETIRPSASRKDVDHAVDALVTALAQARPHNIEQIRISVDLLAQHPEALKAILSYYDSIPYEDIAIRQLCLRIIGHMRLPASIRFLLQIVWAPIPPAPERPSHHMLTDHDRAIMLIIQAVESLAYIRNNESESSILQICREHQEKAVQKAAINAFTWNSKDTQDATIILEKILDPKLHRYIGRVRFTPTLSEKDFNQKLIVWQKRWLEKTN